MRNEKLDMRNKQLGKLQDGFGMGLNWAPRNGKWDSNGDSRD